MWESKSALSCKMCDKYYIGAFLRLRSCMLNKERIWFLESSGEG